jgi:4-amino-4-deoxy-L-arabinose transferase-like glycosyltransferase
VQQEVQTSRSAAASEAIRTRRTVGALAAVLLIALALRVVALLGIEGSLYASYLLWDERVLHTWAEQIANGTYASTAVYQFPPLPAYLLAGLYALFTPNPLWFRLLNLVLGTATCLFVYLIGRSVWSHRVGVVGGLLAAFYAPLILFSVVPMKTALSVFLCAVTLWLLLRVLARPTPRSLLLLGVSCGLALNVRENYFVLLPVIAGALLWLGRRERRPARQVFLSLGIAGSGVLLALAPFVIRNVAVAGEAALTTSQGGFNLYLGNNPQNPDPYYRPVRFASSSPFSQGTHFTIEASRRVGRRLTPLEASRYWTGEVLSWARSQPGAFAAGLGRKALAFLNRFEAGDHYHLPFLRDFVSFFKLPLLGFGLLLPLGGAGMLLFARRSRGAAVLVIVFVFYAASLVLFHTNQRYRLPMLAVLLPFAAAGIVEVHERLREKRLRGLGLPVAAAVALAIVAHLPVRGTDQVASYYSTHALLLSSQGRDAEAVEYWERASAREEPYSVYADYSLAKHLAKRGAFAEARRRLERIPDSSFAIAAKYDLLGDVLLQELRLDEAVQAYENSLGINSAQLHTRGKLVKIFRRTDEARARREQRTLETLRSYDIEWARRPAAVAGDLPLATPTPLPVRPPRLRVRQSPP